MFVKQTFLNKTRRHELILDHELKYTLAFAVYVQNVSFQFLATYVYYAEMKHTFFNHVIIPI